MSTKKNRSPREWRAAGDTMNGRYILNDKEEPVECHSFKKWGEWFQKANRRLVKTELPNDVMVSTVFLGLDHGFGSGPPVLWETMIFGGKHSDYQRRYTSKEDAIRGHAKAVRIAKGEEDSDG